MAVVGTFAVDDVAFATAEAVVAVFGKVVVGDTDTTVEVVPEETGAVGETA